MTIATGTRLGRYEIRSQLGAGGMGEVYLARDPKINRDVVTIETFGEGKDARMSAIARYTFGPSPSVFPSLHPTRACLHVINKPAIIPAVFNRL
jgi:serine/threonine protein kinase